MVLVHVRTTENVLVNKHVIRLEAFMTNKNDKIFLGDQPTFQKISIWIKTMLFPDVPEIQEQSMMVLHVIPRQFQQLLQHWQKQWTHCTCSDGDYSRWELYISLSTQSQNFEICPCMWTISEADHLNLSACPQFLWRQ
jgi:hypothetical protein